MKIKIVRDTCINPFNWYKDRIGEEFEVMRADKGTFVVYDSEAIYFIKRNDCEIISEEEYISEHRKKGELKIPASTEKIKKNRGHFEGVDMKIRNGFVSNSSSSSFVIDKYYLSEQQLEQIRNHSEHAETLGMDYCDCEWEITETPNTICGSTSMDNFDMDEFLNKIGVEESRIFW